MEDYCSKCGKSLLPGQHFRYPPNYGEQYYCEVCLPEVKLAAEARKTSVESAPRKDGGGGLAVFVFIAIAVIAAVIVYAVANPSAQAGNNNSQKADVPRITESAVSPKEDQTDANIVQKIPAPATFLSESFSEPTSIGQWNFYSVASRTPVNSYSTYQIRFDETEGSPAPAAGIVGYAHDKTACMAKSIDISAWNGERMILSFDFKSTYPSMAYYYPVVILVDGNTGNLLSNEHLMNYKSGWASYSKDITSFANKTTKLNLALCVEDSDAENHAKSVWFDNVKIESVLS